MARWCFLACTAPLTRAMGQLLFVWGLIDLVESAGRIGSGCARRGAAAVRRGTSPPRSSLQERRPDTGGRGHRVAADPGGSSGHRWGTPPVLPAEHSLDLAGLAWR